MIKVEVKEKIEELLKFLDINAIFKISTIIKNDVPYLEIESNKNEKVLVKKELLDFDLYSKIMKKYNESRKELFDENYKKANSFNLVSKQGEVKIVFENSKCSITLFASLNDSNVLVEPDEEFLMYMLNKVDNGCEPVIMAKDNQQFYLYMGTLTIKFDRVLLKYIEEFAVNCKYNKKSQMKRERVI